MNTLARETEPGYNTAIMADESKTTKTSVVLSTALLERVDRCAGILLISRSEAVERACYEGIDKLEAEARKVARAFVEGGDEPPKRKR